MTALGDSPLPSFVQYSLGDVHSTMSETKSHLTASLGLGKAMFVSVTYA